MFIYFQHVFRVDVHRKENVGSLEKAITIYGNPENCTNACRRILEVMQQEADNTNKGYRKSIFSPLIILFYLLKRKELLSTLNAVNYLTERCHLKSLRTIT